MGIESQKKYRAFLIIILYFIIALLGLDSYFFSKQIPLHSFVMTLCLAMLLTHICIIDSKIIGKPLPFFSYVFVFVFFGIATPICIVRAHGIKKGVKIILLHLVGFFFTQLIAMLACDFFLFSGE